MHINLNNIKLDMGYEASGQRRRLSIVFPGWIDGWIGGWMGSRGRMAGWLDEWMDRLGRDDGQDREATFNTN